MKIRDDDYFFKLLIVIDPLMERYLKRANIDVNRGMGIMLNYVSYRVIHIYMVTVTKDFSAFQMSEQFRKPPLYPRLNIAVSKVYVINENWRKKSVNDIKYSVNAWMSREKESVPEDINGVLVLTK